MISTTMTTATTLAGERVDSDEDDDKDPNGEDHDDLIVDTTTNLWSDAFLAGRGGYLDDGDDGNNNRNDNDKDNGERIGQRQSHQRQGQRQPDHNNDRQAGGENRGDDWVDRGCGGGINTTINNL